MDYANEIILRSFTPNVAKENCSEVKQAFEWISKIIDSCQNTFHLEGAMRLIELFGEKYGRPDLIEDLSTLYYMKQVMLFIP